MKRVFLVSLGLLGYALAGYPLLMYALARLRPRRVRADRELTPSVSLVVSALDEAATIQAKLDNCFALDYPPDQLEIIVVTDGSTDGTEQRAARRGVVVLHEPERRGKAAALARGADAAHGEVLVFSDANNLYEPKTLRALSAPFADPEVGVVTGRKVIDEAGRRPLDRAEGLYWRLESNLKSWESAIGSVPAVVGEALAVRSTAFRPPPAGTVNDDFELAMGIAADGWRIVYAPDAVSLERASASLSDEVTRRTRITVGRWQSLARVVQALAASRPLLALQVVSHKGLRLVLPYAALAAGVSSTALVRKSRLARVLVVGQSLFLLAALVGWRSERRGGPRRMVFYLPYYLVRVAVATIRGALELRTQRDHSLWTRVKRG